METMTLRQRATLVEALSSSLTHGGTALGTVPKALHRLLEHEAWREFVTSQGDHIYHDRFADFVAAQPPKGLGSDIALVRRIVKDTEALDLLDRALQNAPGGDRRSEAFNFDNVQLEKAPTGNTNSAAHRRLRKSAPELHAEVLAGNLSAHAAMVQAGFRPKTISIPVSRPERVAAYLRKHMPREALTRLVELLTNDD